MCVLTVLLFRSFEYPIFSEENETASNMIDNINKLSSNLDTNKQQQTAASIVNLTDDGEFVFFCFFVKLLLNLDKERRKKKSSSYDLLNHFL